MEITSLHKYISLNKLANGQTEVLFSGQPCLYTSKLNVIAVGESLGDYHWKINPIFAKLVYGANVFEDIPQCTETFGTDEEAVAAGLVKLHEMGAFSTEVDLPEDSYAATLNDIQDEVKATSIQNANDIMDAQKQYNESMLQIFGKELLQEVSKYPQKRKFTIHYTTKDGVSKKKSEEAYSPRGIIKSWKDTIENEYGGKLDDVKHKGVSVMNEAEEKDYKFIENSYVWGNSQGAKDRAHKKIKDLHGDTKQVQSKIQGRTSYIDNNGKEVADREVDGEGDMAWNIRIFKHNKLNESVETYDKWVNAVLSKHSDKKIKFKGRVEQGVHTTSAEVSGEDRSYGVWDHDKEEGHILGEGVIEEKKLTPKEEKEAEEILTALKKDKKFVSKYDKTFAKEAE